MAKKKKAGFRIRIEVLIVLVFFGCFIVWAISKCQAKKQEYTIDDPSYIEDRQSNADTTKPSDQISEMLQDRPRSEASKNAAESNDSNTPATHKRTPPQTVYATKLYVTINGLKLRRGPSLDSPVMVVLPLYEELTFLNEVSDSTEIISLGNDIMANEPWVKVRHWKGPEGWVYGAGVHYYKFKYPGLE